MPQWKLGRLSKESEFSKTFYNFFLKRNSSYVTTIFAVAVVGGIAFDKMMDSVWETSNKGVRARGGGGRGIWRGRWPCTPARGASGWAARLLPASTHTRAPLRYAYRVFSLRRSRVRRSCGRT